MYCVGGIVMLPLVAVGWFIQEICEIGDEKVYIRSGLTEEEVNAFLDAQTGKHTSRSERNKHGDEYWTVKKGGKVFYARFRNKVTIEYKTPNKSLEGIGEEFAKPSE